MSDNASLIQPTVPQIIRHAFPRRVEKRSAFHHKNKYNQHFVIITSMSDYASLIQLTSDESLPFVNYIVPM